MIEETQINLLTEDGQYFETRLLNNWVPEDKAGDFSKALEINNEKLRFAVKKSDLYSAFVKKGKTRLFKSRVSGSCSRYNRS